MNQNEIGQVKVEILISLDYLMKSSSFSTAESCSRLFLYQLEKAIKEYLQNNKMVSVVKVDLQKQNYSLSLITNQKTFKDNVQKFVDSCYSLTSNYKEILSLVMQHYQYEILETARDQWVKILRREPLVVTPQESELWEQPMTLKIMDGEYFCIVSVGMDNKVRVYNE